MTESGDKLAVVTASASGIGLVVARALRNAGWQVAMSDLDPAGEAEAKKIGASFTRCDMGKPAEIVEKTIAGRLRKQLAEITLLGQPFVKDGDITVGKLLAQSGAAVAGFSRIAVGEGIEKKESNFADEVMQQVKGG